MRLIGLMQIYAMIVHIPISKVYTYPISFADRRTTKEKEKKK